MDMLLDFLSQLFMAVATAALPIIAVFLVRLINAGIAVVEAKLNEMNPNLEWLLEDAATMAVRAAEQLGLKKKIDDKYEYAFAVVQSYLTGKGLKVDTLLIRAAIEAAVLKEFPKKDKEKQQE